MTLSRNWRNFGKRALAACLAIAVSGAVAAQDSVPDRPRATPIVRGFENFPFPIRVPKGLYELEPVGKPYEYNRILPLLGHEAAQRGIILPEPWGASGLFIYNKQDTLISDLAVAVSLVEPPPPDAPLTSTPFVTFNNVVSRTEAPQIKLDAWILPFLNFFVTRGHVTGGSDIDVTVDLDEFLPPALCPPVNPCGTATWPFTASINSDTYTFGLVGVFNWDKNVLTLNGSYTFSDSRKATAESIIKVATIGAKYGRLITLGNGVTITPYLGLNYTSSENTIRGTASSPDGLLPAGQNLHVRFEATQKNVEPWSGSLGFALGINRRWSVNFDLTGNQHLTRALVGGTYRF